MRKRIINTRTCYGLVLISIALSALYVSIRYILAPTVSEELDVLIKDDYTMTLVQCILGSIALVAPILILRYSTIIIPSGMMMGYATFLFLAVFIGEVLSFYDLIGHWDTMLHTVSGAMLGAMGLSLIGFLNKIDNIRASLSPSFMALFSFCFSVASAAIWEIYEFAVDSLLHTNLQRYHLGDGVPLIGQEALWDTMKDMAGGFFGALAFSIFCYFSLKRKKAWPEKLMLRKAEGQAQNRRN